MYISFYILAMISFAISLFGLLKAYRLYKEQMQMGNLSYRSTNIYLVEEQLGQYSQSQLQIKSPKGKKYIFKLTINHILNKPLLIGLASFGFLLSLTALILSFIHIHPNESFYENELQQLVNRKVTFNIPDNMELDDYYNVSSMITKSQCQSILFSDDDSIKINESNKDIPYWVSVSLVDPTHKSFMIHSLNDQNQIIDNVNNYNWKWKIKPIKEGKNDIVLRITIKHLNNSNDIQKDLCFIKTVIVKKLKGS